MLEHQCTDDDGQRIFMDWNLQRRVEAGIEELLSLLRGILADGAVADREGSPFPRRLGDASP